MASDSLKPNLQDCKSSNVHQKGNGIKSTDEVKSATENPERIDSHCELNSTEIKVLEQRAMEELSTLSVPCNLEFSCCLFNGDRLSEKDSIKKVKLTSSRHSKKKKAVTTSKKDSANEVTEFYIAFEWINGDDRDMLHQIVQFFHNKLQQQTLLVI